MGGRGANSIKKSTNSKLKNQEKILKAKMDSLGDKLKEYSQYALPSYRGEDKETKANQYYKYKSDYEKARRQYNDVLDEMARQRPKPKETKETYVNGYGEATRREITSASYNRAQKRLDREINARFKNR